MDKSLNWILLIVSFISSQSSSKNPTLSSKFSISWFKFPISWFNFTISKFFFCISSVIFSTSFFNLLLLSVIFTIKFWIFKISSFKASFPIFNLFKILLNIFSIINFWLSKEFSALLSLIPSSILFNELTDLFISIVFLGKLILIFPVFIFAFISVSLVISSFLFLFFFFFDFLFFWLFLLPSISSSNIPIIFSTQTDILPTFLIFLSLFAISSIPIKISSTDKLFITSFSEL